MNHHRYTVFSLLMAVLFASQLPAQVDLGLSFNEFFDWEPTTENAANISDVPLMERTLDGNQVFGNMDTNVRVLYSPDGMNNLAPYIDSSDRFNRYNFSHWQYTDILAWFGGTSGMPVMIPAKPWIDAAHKNGVEVIGCVFLAPQAWGGSEQKVIDFLEMDSNGDFIAVNQLIAIAEYFQFDGWLLNFETDVSSSTALQAQGFVDELNSQYDGTLIWYDAMLPSGSVAWQNQLNSANSYFFQNTDGMFTNYWWNTTQVNTSNSTALGLGRSPFEVYMGADMWPDRTHQPAFTDYNWIDKIIVDNVAKTSVALFATNFTYNYGPFSGFNNDETKVQNFYSTERKIFSGEDENPFLKDNLWKGIANYVPARTVTTSLPFETDFNTGHGLNYYSGGSIVRAENWHNMSHQDLLPSWTFNLGDLDTIQYRFDDAYNGGSHVFITGTASGAHHIPMFSTAIPVEFPYVGIDLVVKSPSAGAIDSITVELHGSDSSSVTTSFTIAANNSWEVLNNIGVPVGGLGGDIASMSINIHSNSAFELKIGQIGADYDHITSVESFVPEQPALTVYPNPSNGQVFFKVNSDIEPGGILKVFNLEGKMVEFVTLQSDTQELNLPQGVFLYEFSSADFFDAGKIIVTE